MPGLSAPVWDQSQTNPLGNRVVKAYRKITIINITFCTQTVMAPEKNYWGRG